MPRSTSTTSAQKAPAKASKPARSQPKKNSKPGSRAVLRDVEAGSVVDCAHCGERVKFQAKIRNRQVIANVYVRGKWDRVEHFHADCYDLAAKPYGEIVGPLDQRKTTVNNMSALTTPPVAATAATESATVSSATADTSAGRTAPA